MRSAAAMLVWPESWLVRCAALRPSWQCTQSRALPRLCAALSTKLEQFAVGLLRSLPPVTVRTLLLRGAGDDNDIFASSSHAHFRGRSLLDVAGARKGLACEAPSWR